MKMPILASSNHSGSGRDIKLGQFGIYGPDFPVGLEAIAQKMEMMLTMFWGSQIVYLLVTLATPRLLLSSRRALDGLSPI